MKYIITEEQNRRLFIKRRINIVNEIIESSFNQIWRIFKCTYPFEQFFHVLGLDAAEQLEFEIKDSKEKEEILEHLTTYLRLKKEEIRDKYKSICN